MFAASPGFAQTAAAGAKTANAKSAAKKICSKTNGTDLPFLKGHNFVIQNYDPATATYEILSPDFPGEGTAWVTLEALAASVPGIKKDMGSIGKHPEDILDQTYMAETDIPTFFEEERDARKGCVNQ